MEKENNKINDLEIYKLARKLSKVAWEVYKDLDWRDRNIIGDQFIRSIDSVGANIVEGYGRYHYRDKIKFYYNSRGSLYESCQHWLELLYEREKINKGKYNTIKEISSELSPKLNGFIRVNYGRISYDKSSN